MIREITFYQEPNNRWYVELPEWEGSKDELEMVLGADDMLNFMSEGEGKVRIIFSTTPQINFDTLELKNETPDVGGGYYHMSTYNGININQDMWLCDVTKFVFGGTLPQTIYLKRVEY